MLSLSFSSVFSFVLSLSFSSVFSFVLPLSFPSGSSLTAEIPVCTSSAYTASGVAPSGISSAKSSDAVASVFFFIGYYLPVFCRKEPLSGMFSYQISL